MNVTVLEPGNRVQLPAEWTEALGMRQRVLLDWNEQGILIRPCPPTTWDEIFATRLSIGTASPDNRDDADEVTGDDFLF